MHHIADSTGRIKKQHSLQDKVLSFLYDHAVGRLLLRPLVMPWVTKCGAKLLNTKASCMFVPLFIRTHSICMKDYEPKKYSSYNDFFTRKLAKGARLVAKEPEAFVSPCDGRLSVYRIDQNCKFTVKHTEYTVPSLLRDAKLADAYANGYVWIFRLCVSDYHRYICVDDGYLSAYRKIPGVFHTVNPVANDHFPIYKENTREYAILHSKHFGKILCMEVGALFVGKIENHFAKCKVVRGEEKGNFAFGGSTIILLTQAGRVVPKPELCKRSKQAVETEVKLGERVGSRCKV